MPRFRDEESRLNYYQTKYGAEEGLLRYEQATGSVPPSDPSLTSAQPSFSPSTGEKAPRRRATTKKPSKRDVVVSVGTALSLADAGLQMLYPPWQEDRLSHEEIGRLADALADEILYSDKLCQWLVKAQKQSVHVKLAYVCISIALPRMAKHGMIPAGMFAAPDTETPQQYQVAENGVVMTPQDYVADNEQSFYAQVEQRG